MHEMEHGTNKIFTKKLTTSGLLQQELYSPTEISITRKRTLFIKISLVIFP